MTAIFTIASLWRYPVKGFQGESLTHTDLLEGALLPGDREWGFTAGHTATDAISDGSWMKKAHFLQLMSFAEAAHLSIAIKASDISGSSGYEAALYHKGTLIVSGDLTKDTVISAFCTSLETIMRDAGLSLRGKIGLRHLQTGGFSDTQTPWISVGGTASISDFASATKTDPDIRRFRLNIWIDTKAPFEELGWVGKRAQLGTSIIRFMEPVGRCAAIDVHPDTAIRSDDLPGAMREHYGHADLGVFAIVEQTGKAALSDRLLLLDD